ncbi:hypothetical protein FRC11_014042, partial [Ceratobasidium sp. 423]
ARGWVAEDPSLPHPDAVIDRCIICGNQIMDARMDLCEYPNDVSCNLFNSLSLTASIDYLANGKGSGDE